MQELLQRLTGLEEEGGHAVWQAYGLLGADVASDDDLVALLRVAGSLARQAEALATAAVEQVQARSVGAREDKLTTRLGCAEADSDAPDSDEPHDPRTRAQRMHDALAVVLGIAARAADAPTIGGAAPRLVVTMSAEDLDAGGWAHLDGIGPVPGAIARQVGCSGSIQRVLHDADGRVVSIVTSDRVFNAVQRRAIIARDGTCVIPGCAVPARWCELHHVEDHARGGPTSIDNGVALCWLHHRTIERVGWELSMRDGVLFVRGPGWWDPQRRWRRASKPPGFASSGVRSMRAAKSARPAVPKRT